MGSYSLVYNTLLSIIYLEREGEYLTLYFSTFLHNEMDSVLQVSKAVLPITVLSELNPLAIRPLIVNLM